jgi:CheY-like chemotaxis protein
MFNIYLFYSKDGFGLNLDLKYLPLPKDFLHILLVDDDAMDRELFREALNSAGLQCRLSEASNGEEGLQVLRGQSLPDLVILDLNMPVKDGRQTLAEIKSDPALRSLPVCIMSTSSAHFDVSKAYESGANLFLVKPLDFRQLVEMVRTLVTLFGKFVSFHSEPAR